MSSIRQQRSARNRRQLTLASPALTPQIATVLEAFTPHSITLGLRQIAQPPVAAIASTPAFGNGLLALLRTANSTVPVSAAFSPDSRSVTLTFDGANIAPGEAFLLGPYDQAVRDGYGGFLAPSIVTVPITPPAPATALYTARATSGTTIAVTIAPGLPVAFDAMSLSNHDDMTDQLPTAYSFDGAVYSLTYAGPVNVHDTLTYTGPALTSDGDVWRNLDRAGVDVSS